MPDEMAAHQNGAHKSSRECCAAVTKPIVMRRELVRSRDLVFSYLLHDDQEYLIKLPPRSLLLDLGLSKIAPCAVFCGHCEDDENRECYGADSPLLRIEFVQYGQWGLKMNKLPHNRVSWSIVKAVMCDRGHLTAIGKDGDASSYEANTDIILAVRNRPAGEPNA